jgi:hypothetical protein
MHRCHTTRRRENSSIEFNPLLYNIEDAELCDLISVRVLEAKSQCFNGTKNTYNAISSSRKSTDEMK